MTVANVGSPDEQAVANENDVDVNGDIDLKSDTADNIPTFEEQDREVRNALRETLVTGDTWYLLDIHWYKQWKKYVQLSLINKDDNEHPGPIDNSPLFVVESTKLKEHLLEGSDYKLISKSGWDLLVQWYSLSPEQEPIARKVIEHGLYSKETKVEVYLTELKLSTFKDLESVEICSFSKTSTVGDVVEQCKRLFDITKDEETRVWNKFMSNTYELLHKLDSTLQDSGIGSGQMLVIEQKDEKGEWPRQTRSRSLSSSSPMNIGSPADSGSGNGATSFKSGNYSQFSNSYGSRHRHMSTKPGLCGLSNIGNTCFMNSTLQCLSNTTPLNKFFISNTYKHELNPTNPLGMHGKIAEAYADLIHNLWNGHNSFFTPRQFKMQVGRFAPQFSGYQQQDSHELLAFLLDGLHEDLNRVKQKPYIELQDDKGRPDEVVAAVAWKNHSLRNSSIIVDYFHGQFKSTVECPVCHKKSVTFDPFCYLSLPLPIKKERSFKVTFVPLDTFKKPVKLKITVPKLGCISDLINCIAQLTGTDTDKLVVTDVFSSKFHKRFSSRDSLSQITDRDDIYVYEVPISTLSDDHEELLVLPVYLREIRKNSYHNSYSYSSNSNLFGVPLLVPVPKIATTTADLYQLILRAMRRFVQPPSPSGDVAQLDDAQAEEIQQEDDQKDNQEADTITDKDEDMEDKNEAMGDKNEAMEDKNEAMGDKNKAMEDKDEAMEDKNEAMGDKNEEESEVKKIPGEQNSISMKQKTAIRLFEVKVVNANGTQDIRTLQFDDEPLKLTSKTYLAVDWKTKVKKMYYDENLAEEIEIHPSVNATPLEKKTIQLKDCLELFLQKEKLGEEDPWYCPQCKAHQQAFKKFDLWTLPKILVIHLKRFSYNRYWRDKLDALVNFPVTQLDLTDYVINKKHPRAVYDLHAVSNHYGGLGGGHYTAYAVNCYDGQWYYFDDTSVSAADAKSPVSKAAYVLFYTRRGDPDNEMMNTSELLTDDPDVFEDDENSMD